jgi:predicted alpha/beta superfamily hydrolase
MNQAHSSLRVTLRRVFRLENRRRTIRAGRLEHLRAFPSAVFGNERDLTIYLPPGYGEREDLRYPVLYMQDGQNLFEPERAFIPGQHWRLAEAADEAIAARAAQPMIIVGVDHAGPARADEYTPTFDAKKKVGGRAGDYARFLFDEVKPAIDSRFQTDPSDTAVGGSSLGGLISLHLGLTHPDVFRAIAALSPSVWWDSRAILKTVDSFAARRHPRLWLDIGGREGRDALNDVRLLRDHLQAKGWTDNLRYFEDRRADHSERAWAKRAKMVLEFLFPPAVTEG